MTISRKIGLHIVGGTSVPLGKPAVVKLVDPSVAYYRQVRAEVGPDCLIIVRWYHAAQPLDAPVANARDWYNAHSGWIEQVPMGERVAYEGWNEIPDSQAAAYSQFEVTRLMLLHAIGRRACVLNASVGTPDLPVWTVYRPMLLAMGANDVIGLHEYWSDRADLENVWHVRRFTLPAVAANIGDRKIVVSECGRDEVEGRGRPGWQLTCSADEYLGDLRRLGELYDGCANVIGATVYQTGSADPQWGPFNVWTLWPSVVAEYATVLPPEDTDVIPYYHSSRNGYRITDIVLHDTEGSAEAAEYWFRAPSNTGRSSAHVIVDSAGEILRLIPDEWAAHHAGFATVPGNPGINPNRFSLGLELEYPRAPASPAWPEAQLAAAADVVREWCDTWGITAEHIWEHKTIDPTRRSDPRNWDRAAFLRRVWPPPAEPYLPTNDPFMQARKTPQERYEGIRWWIEERRRQYEAGAIAYADQIDMALIEQMYKWEQE